ncbi:SWIM zinc finger family protein [Kribbella deserti]|uniref:SWIM zinc finger family protein n=1 Tax=Kribbella deserti TaxID=1926257 RepID=A0ABV6QP49_9ACTN
MSNDSGSLGFRRPEPGPNDGRESRAPWQQWAKSGERGAGKPAASGPGSRRPFGLTWWGKAWVEALQHQAQLDPNRLGRGRSYARRSSVLEHHVQPGAVTAIVQGSRPKPYDVSVRIRAFTDDEWTAVLDVVAAQVGRVAALLDGELPPDLVDDVQAAGLDLLPKSGEVVTSCNCPDFAIPCKHSAAVCYLIADALDEDPFALLLLRGRERSSFLAALRSRRQRPATKTVLKPRGVVAKQAYARDPAEIPAPPRPPSHPGVPSSLQILEPPKSSGITSAELTALATDAVRRAWELASGDGDGGISLTRDEDLARRAAELLGKPGLAELAHRAGISARTLTVWATAWHYAGAAGLAATTTSYDAPPEDLAEAFGVLPEPVTVEANRVTSGRHQLRLGRDGLWYVFTESFNEWTLAAPPTDDPAALI